MPKHTYMRTTGPTPLDDLDLTRKKDVLNMLRMVALQRLLRAKGGNFVLDGMGKPEDWFDEAQRWEIGFRGLGNGKIEVALVDKKSQEAQ